MAVGTALDEYLLHAQAGRQVQLRFPDRQFKSLLYIGGEIVHKRILDIGTGAETVVGELRVKVIFSPSHISVGLPLQSGLEAAVQPAPSARPFVFELGSQVQFLGVHDIVRKPVQRQAGCQVIALFFGMYRRLVGGVVIVAVSV